MSIYFQLICRKMCQEDLGLEPEEDKQWEQRLEGHHTGGGVDLRTAPSTEKGSSDKGEEQMSFPVKK